MSGATEILKLMMKTYRISHGDKELAQKWLYKVANAVTGHEPLSVPEASFVAAIMRANGYLGNATHFWTLGKTQDPRPAIKDEFAVWVRVRNLKEKHGRAVAISSVAEELGYIHDESNDDESNDDESNDDEEDRGIAEVTRLYDTGQRRFREFCSMYSGLPGFDDAKLAVIEDLTKNNT